MAPSLEKVLTFRAELDKEYILMLGPTKGGNVRTCASITGGLLKGDRFDATAIQGGSDWFRLDPATATLYLDGRCHFRDEETGDMFYMTMQGTLGIDEASQGVLGGSSDVKTTKAGDHQWFGSPIFEVSNEKHKWMEQSWFVSQGHWEVLENGKVAAQHDVYRMIAG